VITDKVVVGIAGMPGAGKGIFQKTMKKLGYPVVTMGDAVREEVIRKNLDPTPENLGRIMLNLREKEGSSAIAKRCIPKMENLTGPVIVIDGIRSLVEVYEFKKRFPNFVLLAIHSSPKTRYMRLVRRKRSDDPKDWETFIERDQRELGIGMGSVISVADYMIINEGTIRHLHQKTLTFVGKVLKDE